MTFPTRPTANLTLDQTIGYLENLIEKGFTVYSNEKNSQTFTIDFITSSIEVIAFPSEIPANKAQITLKGKGKDQRIGHAENYDMLVGMVEEAAKIVEIDLGSALKSVRIKKGEPASNLGKIVTIVSSAIITELFDPYIDDKGLLTLIALRNLGLKFSPKLRVLTSSSKLSTSVWDMFKMELKLNEAEIRKMSNQHRRFMLGGGQIFIIGASFNQVNHNEAIYSESDAVDKPFFESEWKNATNII
jgi:hypothetical protein